MTPPVMPAPGGTGITRPSSPRLTLPPPYTAQPSPPGGFGMPGGPPMMPSVSSSGIAAPLGEAQRPLRPSRAGLYAVLTAAAVLIIGGSGVGYWWSMNRPGSLQLTVVPADATVSIDNVKVGDHSPITIDDKAPGTYMVSVTHDGYLRHDQNIELRAGQQTPFAITLEASPDAGFELTSEPPGGLVWFDGVPIKGPTGEQARTDFRAYRIPAGHHVLEIKGENRFKPWRQDIDLEAGAIQKVHATLVPTVEVVKVSPQAQRPETHAEARADTRTEPRPEPRPEATHTSSSGSASRSRASTGASGAATEPPPLDSSKRRNVKKPRDTVAVADGTDSSDDGSESASPAAEGGDCSITIGSRPWSEVWIDGRNTTKHTPFADYKVPCGKHKISFKRPDLQIDHTETISVRAGQKFKQSFTLETEQPE